MEYVVSSWDSLHDNAVKQPFTGDWEQLRSFLENYVETDDKYSPPLFNLVKFDALKNKTGQFVECKRTREYLDQRVKTNVSQITGFVIDYDNDSLMQESWTMDQVAEKFKDFEFVIYTSYSHWKNEHIEKFRLILPLSEPIPIADPKDYDCWVQSFRDFFGYIKPGKLPPEMQYRNENGALITQDKSSIDGVSFVPSQGFFLPSCPVGHKVLYRHNKGKFVTPDHFEKGERVEVRERTFEIPKDATVGGEGTILKQTFDSVRFFKEIGAYVKQLDATKHKVICPLYHEHTNQDKSGTVLFVRDGQLDHLHCNHNHDVSMWSIIESLPENEVRKFCVTQEEDPVAKFIKARRGVKEGQDSKAKEAKVVKETTVVKKPELTSEPFTEEKRDDLIGKTNKRIRKNKPAYTLLFSPEGFGKSKSAARMQTVTNRCIVFASQSNEQVLESAEGFRQYKYKVQVIRSRSMKLLQGYKVEAVLEPPAHPWAQESVNKEKTLDEIMLQQQCSKDDAEEIWIKTAPDEPDFKNHDIICTTMARVMVWGKKQANRATINFHGSFTLHDHERIVPKGTMIYFDDPDRQFFQKYAPHNEKYVDVKINGRTLEVIEHANREWFVRPPSCNVDYGHFDCHMIFTTTEIVTRMYIERDFPNVFVPSLMPPHKMKAGDITMIKTPVVRKKHDGYLPIMMERVRKVWNKRDREVTYISDGQGNQNNLVSSRGKNQFIRHDTVIEISKPHYDQVAHVLVELQWDIKEKEFVACLIALDALQQGIGRNSGYRWIDQDENNKRCCVVVCEPLLLQRLVAMMRYVVDTVVLDPLDLAELRLSDDCRLDQIVASLIVYDTRYIGGQMFTERAAFRNDVKSLIDRTPPLLVRKAKRRIEIMVDNRLKTASGTNYISALNAVKNIVN